MSSNFFAMVNRMKLIDRWALMNNSTKENIAEHSHSVAVIAHALALIGNKKFGKSYNAERAALLALYHDTTEVITGDMPTPVKYYNDDIKNVYKNIECIAGKRLLDMLPEEFRSDYESFFEKKDEDKELWKLVKAADKISALIKCIEEYRMGNREFEKIKTLGYHAMAAFNTSTRMFDGLMYFVVILAGGLSLVYGKITAGDLVAYMLYVTTLIATIRRIVEFAEQFQRGMTGIERFAEIMDTPVAIKDAPDAVPLQPGPGEIRFEKVCFEYPDDHNKVLHDVSLDIRAGERLALVGASGGGKTTLCNLIPRFYEVTSGRILIDGQDIRRVTLKSLRQDIGIVQQDVYLFSGTVAQNIAYGKPGATRQEIEAAARLAGAEKFILALKDGYDTYVGERGVKLSGGQKQRIAIARVFLKNPPILILDEATSALDNESEILVGQSLEKLAHGRTTLTIAHRLTTIKDYDRILVLGEEGIVEEGTHAQLLAKQGVYYRLWNQLPAEDGE